MAPTNTLKRKESLVSTHEAPAPLAKGKMLARRETATYHEYAPSEKGSRHTITPLFEAKHRAFKANFFSRNPELWPVFANEDALEVITWRQVTFQME
ncbi:hypothetical protein SARC_09370 [Sphaeroforma arctica JP610]|uniref:Uncharacterized protein n=1 Tax=Sphaeroforma arctica JP610 TaxID=667725 RepID=A0A0L0FN42_9EUKA|nr:hypothetical protein SARC_09370 [Sphaeroforma arctica JP610]KNC78187.1 hypothetical protein SARC_09370 [Sphaeroforma arctica JP610]|eukprot:XP_014152089.1 hypothetical protein SARC_09370 [Sphaeroforma arctica JP610]